MIAAFNQAPAAARLLALAGLIPFWALALAPRFGINPPQLQAALIGYAAVILSFVGALHWGLAAARDNTDRPLPAWRSYGYSVVPALVAWVALLLPYRDALTLLSLAFIGAMFADQRWLAGQGLPVWFVPLRTLISVLVILALYIAQLSH
ncbi:MAG: DUF3429 domain-containing protein [Rhodocyclaceae bacterium]|nr:DUF3429 domain-containing protein [Rhodocyclaceae bacterium]